MNDQPSAPPRSLAICAAFLALIAATLGYYYWTSQVFHGSHHAIHGRLDDHFNLLSHGFQKGQLSLDLPVPQALLDSRNPYDPALRPPVFVPHDASLFRGRYYIYFGPAPVLTLFLPFSVLTGHDLPISLAVFLFCSGGYLALVALYFFLQRRYYPRASSWTLVAALLALGGGTMVISLLRRPNIWEVACSAGFFYFAVSLLCLIRALHSHRAAAWAVAGGFALGLAVASRPTYLVCSLLFALPVLRRPRPSIPRHYGWSALVAAAIACSLLVLGLLTYNFARFGEPFEFGQKYQLSAIIEGDAHHFSPSYVPYNFTVYFLSPLRWFGAFPFVRSVIPPEAPPGHAGHEFALGLLPNLPFVAFALTLVVAFVLRPRHLARTAARWTPIGIIAAAAVISLAPVLFFFGACVRYMADFSPSFMLLAALGLLETESCLRHRLALLLLRSIASLLAAFTFVVAALAMADTYNSTPATPPDGYAPLARVLNTPVRTLDRFRRPDYGPWELSLTFPSDRSPRREPLLAVTKWSESAGIFFVEYIDATSLRFGYLETVTGIPPVFSPIIPAPSSAQALRVTLGEPAAPLQAGTKSWLRVHLDGRAIWENAAISLAAFPGRISVGSAPAAAGTGPRFTGQIHSSGPASGTSPSAPITAPRPFGGARVRMNFLPDLRGRALPLATTGMTGAGDLLFVRLLSADQIVLGYDHWGEPTVESPPISIRPDQPLVFEFWLPVLASTQPPPPLRVDLDGTTVWRTGVKFHPATRDQLYFGYNPIGGTSAEPVLNHGTIEDTYLPFPLPTSPKN